MKKSNLKKVNLGHRYYLSVTSSLLRYRKTSPN